MRVLKAIAATVVLIVCAVAGYAIRDALWRRTRYNDTWRYRHKR